MLRIRLSRHGAKKDPHYRVVVAEKTSPRDGRFVEIVGYYNPALKPKRLKLKVERIEHWIGKGAQPSATVKSLLKRWRQQLEETSAEEVVEKKASPAEPEASSSNGDDPKPAEEADKKTAAPEEAVEA